MSLSKLLSAHTTAVSRLSKPDRTGAHNWGDCNIMNVGTSLRFQSLVDCVNHVELVLQHLFINLNRLMAKSYKPRRDLMSTRAIDQERSCKIWLDQARMMFKCPHISNLETFLRIRIYNFCNEPIICTNNGPHGRRPVLNRRFRSQNRSQQNQKARLFVNLPSGRPEYAIPFGLVGNLTGTWDDLTGLIQKKSRRQQSWHGVLAYN